MNITRDNLRTEIQLAGRTDKYFYYKYTLGDFKYFCQDKRPHRNFIEHYYNKYATNPTLANLIEYFEDTHSYFIRSRSIPFTVCFKKVNKDYLGYVGNFKLFTLQKTSNDHYYLKTILDSERHIAINNRSSSSILQEAEKTATEFYVNFLNISLSLW